MISIRTLIHRLQQLGTEHGDGTPVAVDGMEWVNGVVRVRVDELEQQLEHVERENRRLREAVAALSPPA